MTLLVGWIPPWLSRDRTSYPGCGSSIWSRARINHLLRRSSRLGPLTKSSLLRQGGLQPHPAGGVRSSQNQQVNLDSACAKKHMLFGMRDLFKTADVGGRSPRGSGATKSSLLRSRFLFDGNDSENDGLECFLQEALREIQTQFWNKHCCSSCV